MLMEDLGRNTGILTRMGVALCFTISAAAAHLETILVWTQSSPSRIIPVWLIHITGYLSSLAILFT